MTDDDEPYPTEEELKAIATWSGDLFNGGLHAWFDLIHPLWNFAGWGWKRIDDTYDISTGGWSGNEEIIDAMMENSIAWNLTWQQSRRGGHYLFTVPVQRAAAPSPTAPPVTSP